ncbi:MAG: transketolase [Spirochaetales bacterium]|nr:transketolase [Spirochaetales bacterium]
MKSSKQANALRILAMDGVQKAKSGHPGAPMGMADMAEVLWRRNLNHNPAHPEWFNRDRFVLSNGHASMLIYSLLHLTGYDLSLEDLKKFRQLGSKTPGHPEYGDVPGVDTTTGPLGQGISNAVGMALAEKILAARYNKKDFPVVDHYTYTFMGDGCMMEGISHEAASFAGTHKLGKLIAFYDDNGISIDGEVEGWFTDDTGKRFDAYGWQVIGPVDGHDSEALQKALDEARADGERPSLIICKTTIGFGSPNKAGKEESHGAPLGEDECLLARKELGWDSEELFYVPEELYADWDAREKGAESESAWNQLMADYRAAYPLEGQELSRRMEGKLPENWEEEYNGYIKGLLTDSKAIASRKASQASLEEMGKRIPQLIGGSADLAPSNLTLWSGSKSITPEDSDGNYIHFGVREFAMTALVNGLVLHGGFLAYNATFLIFKDYAQNAIRMAALMKQQSILIYTHDSIGVGEDGPTHQPVEQVPTLRLIPGVHTWRPADWLETAVAWREAVKYTDGPSALALSRQNLEPLARTEEQAELVSRGGYTLVDCDGTADLILIATGSEVKLCVDAAAKLTAQGKKVRVVSMPCTEIFDAQDGAYKESVLPKAVTKRLAVEAQIGDMWYKYVGLDGAVLGMEGFGASGPGAKLFDHFGFTVDNVVSKALSL